MIKAVIFDLDGVIIESAEIKTRAFEQLFADYHDKVREIVDYHKKNAGISRYIKFRHIYDKMLGKSLSPAEEAELGEEFSRIVLEQILRAPFVPGAIEFLGQNKNRYSFFLASGTPEGELKYILDRRGLSGFFLETHGAPKDKPDIIQCILDRYAFQRKETVFIGDAENDWVAAERTGILFIARLTQENHQLRDCRWKVNDLTDLHIFLQNTCGKGSDNR